MSLQAGFEHLDDVLALDRDAMAEAAAARARAYLQLTLDEDRVHFVTSESGLERRACCAPMAVSHSSAELSCLH